MYEKYWKLGHAPFDAGTDPARFYPSPTHEEALSRLSFLVDHRRHLGILSGPSGTGKSLLLNAFADHCRQQSAHVTHFSLEGLAPAEFVWKLAAELGLSPDDDSTTFKLWRQISDRIVEHNYQQLDTIVILDDANHADSDTIAHVTRLAKSDRAPQPRLRLFLATCPEGMRRLGWSLLEMAELRIELPAWELEETADFVSESLRAAGRSDEVFAPDAVARLHECAAGVPRRVCQIAQLALLAGAGQQLDRIDLATIDAVVEELGVGQTATPQSTPSKPAAAPASTAPPIATTQPLPSTPAST